ncbi:MAG: hypothetical protein ACXU95_08115 [Isosphaeraceae bacterium]
MAHNLTNLSSDGALVGQTVSDKIGFWGVSPVTQSSLSAGQMSSSAATITTVQALISILGTYGLIKAN